MIRRYLIKLLRWLTREKSIERRAYIQEPRIKIMYNPYEETFRWTRLDPKTHIWTWQRKPTVQEINAWNMQPESLKTNGIPDQLEHKVDEDNNG